MLNKSAGLLITILLSIPAICFAQRVEDAALLIHSPAELSTWLSRDFKYELEIPDYWQSADETLHSGKGDCDDFAILSSAILTQLGVPNQILVIKFRDLKQAHAVCVFQEKESGNYNFISNQSIIATNKQLLREAVEAIYPDWEAIVFTNQNKEYQKVITRDKTKNAAYVHLETTLY